MKDRFVIESPIRSLAILMSVLFATALLGIAPHWAASWTFAKFEDRQPLLSALERQVAQLSLDRNEGEERHTPALERRILLDGSTGGIAGADLQKLLRDLALQHRGRVSSFQVRSPIAEQDRWNISVILTARFKTKGLRDFIYAVETGEPFLFVDKLSIQRIRPSGGAGQTARQQVLDVSIQVSGYLAKDEAS